MSKQWYTAVINATGAVTAVRGRVIQSLWSGYGEIVRVELQGAAVPSVILKSVKPPEQMNHPRGWNTSLSHARKLRSYAVEMAWYNDWSARCSDVCRVPYCYAVVRQEREWLMILEDLDVSGFPARREGVDRISLHACLQWRANFHATFLGDQPLGLWETGTYWHLATRPDEWEAMEDGRLKQAAGSIDQRLNECRFQTLVHGDAKLANFCFSETGGRVAAVDFQYVGGGCGMKDVAYFIGSCVDESRLEVCLGELLDYYFQQLHAALMAQGKALDWPALEAEWRSMFPLAWTDFYRFLIGWMPGHWKVNAYSQRLAEDIIGRE